VHAATIITVATSTTTPTLEVVAGNAAAERGLSASGRGFDSAKQLQLRCVDETANRTLQAAEGPFEWTVREQTSSAT
jgi:hypothetical protein